MSTVRALVCHGPGHISRDTAPDLAMQEATDAIVRGRDVRGVRGRDVHGPRPGHEVIVSSVSARGRRQACRDTGRGQCRGGGGWIPGNQVDGTRAGVVRAPFAEHSTHRPPRRGIVVDLSEARLEAAARVGADAAEPPGKTIAEHGRSLAAVA